jgi:hypothetical protein
MRSFHKYQQQCKRAVELGQLTKDEATYLILGKAREVIESLKMPDPEQENMYQARSIN